MRWRVPGPARRFARALGSWILAASLALGVPAGASAQTPAATATPQEARTTLDGVYTAEQAQRGRATYQRVCSACHALTAYTGEAMEGWKDGVLYDLFDLIRTKMPEDNPGSLRRSEYTDVLAFILELNGMPPGDTPLSSRASELRKIVFTWRDTS